MNQTEKLYDLDAYKMEFKATVLSCQPGEHSFAVVLDRTLFFPEEGGQTPDRGFLGGSEVIDVQIKEGMITHWVKEPLTVGELVEGQVDFRERFSNMQQHSAEHILSGLLYKSYGYENVGFHLSSQTVTMDVSGSLSEQQIEELFRAANRVITENVAITASYPEPEALKEMWYRSKKEIEGPVRIVTIDHYDACACCAPHVSRTGEIGCVKLIKWENYKGGLRFTILAGERGMEDTRKKQDLLDQICQSLSTNTEQLQEAVDRLKNENQELKYQLAEVALEKVKEIGNRVPAGSEPVVLVEGKMDQLGMKTLMNSLQEKCTGIVAIFAGENQQYRYMMTAGEGQDARKLNEMLKEEFPVKGGGNAKMVQGTVTAEAKSLEAGTFIQKFETCC